MKSSSLILALLAATFAASCRGPRPAPEPGDPLPFKVERFTRSGVGSVNSYWFATDEGAVVIDGQRRRSDAQAMLRSIDERDVRIRGILVTHAHPDHVGGLDVVIAATSAGTPILVSGATLEALADDYGGWLGLARGKLGDDFGGHLPGARRIVSGEQHTVAGVTFDVREVGRGEAESMTLYWPLGSDSLFCGDLVANRMTPFLGDGHIREWIRQLELLQAQYPLVRRLYPGHGEPGPIDQLVREQLEYLVTFRDRVAKALEGDRALTAGERAEIVRQTNNDYPGYLPVAEIEGLIDLNAKAVARELGGQ